MAPARTPDLSDRLGGALGGNSVRRDRARRDAHRHGHALTRCGDGRDCATVRLNDGGHDGKPEATAAAYPGARRVGAVEPFEDAAGFVTRHAGARVAYL